MKSPRCIALRLANALALLSVVSLHTGALAQQATASESQKSNEPSYQVLKSYRLPGDGTYDFITFDQETHRLYVPHGSVVDVLDSENGKYLGHIGPTPGVHDAQIAPGSGHGFTTNGGSHSIGVFDTKSFELIKTIPSEHPETIVYDQKTDRVFAIGAKITVINPKSLEVLGLIPLPDSPDASFADQHGKLYVSLANEAALAVIDTVSMQLMTKIPLPGCRGPHGATTSFNQQRIFVACRDGGLLTLNAENGQALARTTICSGVDGLVFDEDRHLLFASCAEGVMSVVGQITPNTYRLMDTVPTGLYAKTVAYDSSKSRLYLPTASFSQTDTWVLNEKLSEPVAYTALAKPPRSKMIANSFKVLVVGLGAAKGQ